jgi:ParB/RepB/Spo0J family partition protein
VSRSNVYNIDPRLLKVDTSSNARFKAPSDEALDEMAKSLAADGQIQPIGVRREGKDLEVVYGFHRTLGAIHGINAGILPEDFTLRYEIVKEKDPEKLYMMRVGENLDRVDLTSMDKARIVGELRDKYGLSQKEISVRLNKTESWVSQIVTLLDIPEAWQELIHAGRMSAQMIAQEYAPNPNKDRAIESINRLIKSGVPINSGTFRKTLRDVLEEHGELDPSNDPTTTAGETEEENTVAAEKTGRSKRGGKQPKEADTKRNLREVRDFFTELAEVPEGEEANAVHAFSLLFLKFLDGKFGDKKMKREIAQTLGVE